MSNMVSRHDDGDGNDETRCGKETEKVLKRNSFLRRKERALVH